MVSLAVAGSSADRLGRKPKFKSCEPAEDSSD